MSEQFLRGCLLIMVVWTALPILVMILLRPFQGEITQYKQDLFETCLGSTMSHAFTSLGILIYFLIKN